MRKLLSISLVAAIMISVSACGAKTEPETTTAVPETVAAVATEVVTEATTEAVTEATTEAVTEATTEESTPAFVDTNKLKKEGEGVPIDVGETYDAHRISNSIPWIKDEIDPEYQYSVEPPIGETDMCYYYIFKRTEEAKGHVYGDYFKTVSLPMWGIYKIAVDPALFPDDETKMIKLEREKFQLKKLGEEGMERFKERCGGRELYIGMNPCSMKELGIPEDGSCDISERFPGSMTRKSYNDAIQIWAEDNDFTIKQGDTITSREIFDKLYPYRFIDFVVGDKYYAMTDDSGYTYVFMDVIYPEERQKIGTFDDKPHTMYGGVLFRLKDGKSQGVMYMTIYDQGKRKANYVLNQTCTFMDINKIDGGNGTCAGFFKTQKQQ